MILAGSSPTKVVRPTLSIGSIIYLFIVGPHYFEFGRCLMKHAPEEGEHIGDSIRSVSVFIKKPGSVAKMDFLGIIYTSQPVK